MFELKWSEEAIQEYNSLRDAAAKSIQSRKNLAKAKSSKAEGLFKQVHKTIELLKSNPRHPGLNSHEYDSLVNPYYSKKKVWEAYAQNKIPGAYRVFWCYGPARHEITILAITSHP